MPRVLSVTALVAAGLFLLGVACKKSDDNKNTPADPSARTVDNFSGTYMLSALTASVFGQNINLYDSLEACSKDDQVVLNKDLTVNFIDAGVKCTPPTDSSGTWHLSANTDSIYIGDAGGKISSWDGTTLIIVEDTTIMSIPAVTTATFKKG